MPEVIPEISDAVWEEGFNKLQVLLTDFESKIRDDYDAAEFEASSLGDGTFTRLQVEALCSRFLSSSYWGVWMDTLLERSYEVEVELERHLREWKAKDREDELLRRIRGDSEGRGWL